MRFRLKVAAHCCLLAAFVGASAAHYAHAAGLFLEQRGKAETHAERGAELARAGNLDSAEAELRQATALAPANPEMLTTLGTVLAMQKKLEESSQVFRRALQISPNELTARRYLAANLWQLHRNREAKENLQVILRQKPNDKQARLLLGMVSENLGDYASAAKMLGSVPEEVRKQPESIAALARSYYHLRQVENARATLTLLAAPPTAPQAVFLSAQIADEMQDYPTAEKLLASIRSTFSEPSQIDYTLALVEYHAGRFEQTQNLLEKLIASGTKTAPIFNLLGWSYHKQARPTEAVQALEESIKLAPREEANYLDLSKILLAQHSLPSAMKSSRRTTVTFPQSAPAFELQGLVEMGVGQFTDAIRSYTQAVQIDPSRPDGILGLAQAQFIAGLSQDASASFETGLKKFPKDSRFKTQYAVMLLKQSETGDPTAETRAEQLLGSALQLDPSLSEAHYQLGNLDLRKGRMAEAQQHLEHSAKLDAQSVAVHFALARVYRRLGRKEEAAHEMELYENLRSTDSQPKNPPQANAESRE
jgi:tetratricopeptide (TPR) repeat protein